jgi:alpha-methylacyl-CoA racemase
VIELASAGPGPFACMLLGDMGADVIRVERPDAAGAANNDVVLGGRVAELARCGTTPGSSG